MTDYVLWRRGLRGHSIAVVRGHPAVGVEEKKTLLSGPTEIAAEHAGKPLRELAILYPPPKAAANE